ncbi:MAG: pyridoxal-phosphate dependent enzyme [Candidatus Omnitrophica bacterium]|nr:pyridoxal-phosphate dependent enzyme [Candidatus Omnitrophota bacterium]
MEHFPFFPTPLTRHAVLSALLGVTLFIKQDDWFAYPGGGSKARKARYIFWAARERGHDAVVTAGGLHSNHLRVSALMAAELGWKSILIVHAEKPAQEHAAGNLKLARLAGAQVRFVPMTGVAAAMDQAMADLQAQGRRPYYLWGGGHCLEGTYAYYGAVKEVRQQLADGETVDEIIVASGTGTTQAGIEVGCRECFPGARVRGISIARDEERGRGVIETSMRELYGYLRQDPPPQAPVFDVRFRGGGYEAVYPELLETIRWAARRAGLILDPTYTGKAFHALRRYIAEGAIARGAAVLFWHTGGILNLLASRELEGI